MNNRPPVEKKNKKCLFDEHPIEVFDLSKCWILTASYLTYCSSELGLHTAKSLTGQLVQVTVEMMLVPGLHSLKIWLNCKRSFKKGAYLSRVLNG